MFSSPITGAAITSHLTSPTFTVSSTSGPDVNTKAVIVTALGGTQANVGVHSVDANYSLIYSWPKVWKTIGAVVATVAGRIAAPKNRCTSTLKKSVSISTTAVDDVLVRIEVVVPAGAALFDPNSVASAISAAAGHFYADADDIAACMISGVTP